VITHTACAELSVLPISTLSSIPLTVGMAGFVNNFLEKRTFDETPDEVSGFEPVADSGKSFYERVWPVLACGFGLFSDGYLNGVRSYSPSSSISTPPDKDTGHWLGQHYARSNLS